jgi:hypothetical protein
MEEDGQLHEVWVGTGRIGCLLQYNPTGVHHECCEFGSGTTLLEHL